MRLVPAEPPSAARARVLAARGQGLMLLARHQESRACCEEAIAIARAVGARAEEGHALNTLGCDLGYLGDPAAAVEHLVRAREIAAEVGDLDDLARAYLNLSELLARPLNRLDEALALAREGIELSRRVGLAGDYGVSLQTTAADVLFWLGRWEEAAAILRRRRGAPPDRDGGDRPAPGLGQAQRRARRLRRRRSRHLDGARRMMIKTVDPQYQAELRAREAELALWQGRPDEAGAAAAAGLRRPDRHRRRLVRRPAAVARRCARRRTPRGADGELLERARAIGGGARFVPAVTTAYALLCEAEADRGEPEPWQRAAEAWDALGHPFPAAYARWRQAEALLARRRAREGAEVLVAAHAAAERLGAAPLVAELVAAGAPRAGGARRRAAAEPADARRADLGLTRREREVLGLVAEGMTNREIAQALFVTEKTAGAHVSNILAQAAGAQPARGRDRGAAPRAAVKTGRARGPEVGRSPNAPRIGAGLGSTHSSPAHQRGDARASRSPLSSLVPRRRRRPARSPLQRRERRIRCSPSSPPASTPDSAARRAIALGPDGNLWMAEARAPGRIAKVTPAGAVTEFTGGVTPGLRRPLLRARPVVPTAISGSPTTPRTAGS